MFDFKEERNKHPTRRAIIKKTIRESIDENKKFKEFLEENKALGRYIKDVTANVESHNFCINTVLKQRSHIIRNGSIFNNHTIINETLNWSKTSEGAAYWDNLYKKSIKEQNE